MTSKEIYRKKMAKTVVSIGTRLSIATLTASAAKDEELADDLSDVQNRMIVLLRKHFPDEASGSEGLKFNRFYGFENLTKDRS